MKMFQMHEIVLLVDGVESKCLKLPLQMLLVVYKIHLHRGCHLLHLL